MSLDVQKASTQNHQETAQSLLDHSATLKQLFQDQWFYLWTLTAKNLWQIDAKNKQLCIADGLLTVEFSEHAEALVQFSSSHKNIDVQQIADYIFKNTNFLIRELKLQHSLFLQTKVQLFRHLLVEEVFKWVDGENRIEHFLYNLSIDEAKQLDQIMLNAGYYQQQHLTEFAELGKAIPLAVELNFKHLSLVNSVLGDNFLPVQQLIPLYDQLCFSAQRFLPKPLYRIIESAFDEQFSLAQVLEHQNDFKLLLEHAKERPHLLAFSQWMKRGYWQYKDIFSKKNFISTECVYWNEAISNKFPLFYYKRSVNWLFKQNTVVIDWVAKNLDNLNVRIGVTALSFVDSSQIQPHVILQSLKYFESIALHLLLEDISHLAKTQKWFAADTQSSSQHNHRYVLRVDSFDSAEQQPIHSLKGKVEITHSVLYADEWLNLLFLMSKDDQRIAKQAYSRLSRVIQAYMLFLQGLVQDLPEELLGFMHPQLQQDPGFLQGLKKHRIDVQDFRNRFKHPATRFTRAFSVFDSYVADYLNDLFSSQTVLAKNLTWGGLYQQAIRWHQRAHFEDTLAKLSKRVAVDQWDSLSPKALMLSEHWKFEELNSLEMIIQESIRYKHCLALSYTERIAMGEYVAFHMSSLNDEKIHLTLGCFLKLNQLHFDQLRLPNNEVASEQIERDAKAFIMQVNQHLSLHFKQQQMQSS